MYKSKTSGAILLLMCYALLLSACGGGNVPNAQSSGTSSAHANEVVAAPKPFEHSMGKIEVPANPQRIAGLYLDDHLLALGIQPAIETAGSNKHDYLKPLLGDLVQVDPAAINFEALLAAKPDLIILSHPYYAGDGKYDLFSRIAPTYVFDDGKWLNDWRGTLRILGELTAKSEEAEQFIKSYDEKVADAKQKLHAAIGEQTAALIRVENKRIILYGGPGSYSGEVLYSDLGITPPEIVKKLAWGEKSYAEISMETIPDLQVDHLFITTYPNDESKKKTEEILASELWKKLPAVKNGNVHNVSMDYWMTPGPLAFDKKVDDVLLALVK